MSILSFLKKTYLMDERHFSVSSNIYCRRRYAAAQSAQTTIGIEALHSASDSGISTIRQDQGHSNGFNDPSVCNTSHHLDTFMIPSNSSSSTYNTSLVCKMDKVSFVVNMLKETLERKKLSNQNEKEVLEYDSSNWIFCNQETEINTTFN